MNQESEAFWALGETRRQGFVDDADSALLFISWNTLENRLDTLNRVWGHPRVVHTAAIKAQPHPAVLRRVVSRGFGLEAASWEEVLLARLAGSPAHRVVFDSPVKTVAEILDCDQRSPGMLLNANSLEELPRLVDCRNVRVGLRINTLTVTDAPAIYCVSADESKFGVPANQASDIRAAALNFPITALHCHSGSAMASIHGAVEAVRRLACLADEINEDLRAAGVSRQITLLDIGGGLKPDSHDGQRPIRMEAYVNALRAAVPQLWSRYELVTEFGQWLFAEAGYAVSDVEYVLKRGSRHIACIHLGADFMLRDAYTTPRGVKWIAVPRSQETTRDTVAYDIAGPLCFAGDYLDRNITLPVLRMGDQLLMLGVGANAYGMWSRHCSRTIPKVVGVDFNKRCLEVLSPRSNPFLPASCIKYGAVAAPETGT